MLDLITIGDVTEDVYVHLEDVATVTCDVKHHCSLQFPFGTKLSIKHIEKLTGGNAGNVAIGASLLNLKTAIYTELGDDSPAQLILKTLHYHNVKIKYLHINKNKNTNYSVILNFGAERTILSHHEPRTYHLPKLPLAKWIYLTSMGQEGKLIFPQIIQYLKSTNTNVAFNPGTHQLNLGLNKLKPILKLTKLLILNKEEAQRLLNIKTENLKILLHALNKLGPEIVVITDGPNGSHALSNNTYYFCPIYNVKIVEQTGAGDAFSSAFLTAIINNQSIPEALRWGSVNSAYVLTKIGPIAGLLTKTKIQSILKQHPPLKIKQLT